MRGALRFVLVVALGFVALTALPGTLAAQTTFTQADLQDTWRFYGLSLFVTSTTEGGAWTRGTLTFNSSGGVSAISLVSSDGFSLTTPPTGSLTVFSSGAVSGTLVVSSTGATDSLIIQATMAPAKNLIVGRYTDNFTETGGSGHDYAFFVMAREPTVNTTQDQLAGTWRFFEISTSVALPGGGFREFGTATVDRTGAVTGGTTTSPRGPGTISGGTLTLAAFGLINNGTIVSGGATTTLNATLAGDNSVVVGVATTPPPAGTTGQTDLSLVLAVRELTSGFSQLELGGTWAIHGLSVNAADANDGEWFSGSLTFDSSGGFTSGSVNSPTGETTTTLSPGSISMNAGGVITGSLMGSPGPDNIHDINGVMLPSKTEIVGLATNNFIDLGVSGTSYSGFMMVRQSASVATATLTIVRSGTGIGRVLGGGIDCPGACEVTVRQGTSITLSATPFSGSTFSGWSGGGCSGTSGCTVTLLANTTVTAIFGGTIAVNVVRSGAGTGQVVSSPVGISCGSVCSANFGSGVAVTLTATADANSVFAGWSGPCSGTGVCSFTVTATTTATATFDLRTFRLGVIPFGSGTGTVVSNPTGINCGPTCNFAEARYAPSTMVTLTATPTPGSTFRGWYGPGTLCNGSTSPTCSVTMMADQVAEPRFSKAFTDDPVSVRSVAVKAVHVNELRTAIDTLRSRLVLAPVSWTDAPLTARSTLVRAIHLTELRDALNDVYRAVGFSPLPTYTDSPLVVQTTVIKAIHVSELRTAVRAVDLVSVSER